MHVGYRKLAALLGMAILTLALPAGAHPEPEDGDTHSAAHTSPGGNSTNMHRKAFVPKSSAQFQSDLAFQGNLLFAGNYNGFRIIDIKSPSNPSVIADVWCPGEQGDISVWGDLVVVSVDQVLTGPSCGALPATTTTADGNWEGLRFFSVEDVLATPTGPDGFKRPQPLATVYLDCGSHTHTGYPAGDTLFVYNSSYALRSGPTCGPENASAKGYDPLHGKIGIVEVPLDDPADFSVSYHMLDSAVVPWNLISGPGFNPMRACHDIQVDVANQMAAAACASVGQVWDLSDPMSPQTLWTTDQPEVQFYHSALFSEDRETVIFGDEIIIGHCNDGTGSGQLWFHDSGDGTLLSAHQTPRNQAGPEGGTYCSAHLFNNIPTNKGNVLVASWYSAGTAVVDYSDPANPKEIGFFDPADTATTLTSTWAAYWYNGLIYTNDGTGRVGTDRSWSRGVDVFLLSDKVKAAASAKKLSELNPQTQY